VTHLRIEHKATKSPSAILKYSPGSTPNWNHINLVAMTSKLHSNKVHKPFYRRYKITKPIRKSIPEGEGQARFSCRQLDRAGNPVVSPSRARANTLVNSSFTEIPESTRQHNTTQPIGSAEKTQTIRKIHS